MCNFSLLCLLYNLDFDIATERICVQRPPTDGEERCANTIIERKPVYMCFCQGDLCNSAPYTHGFNPLHLFIITLFLILLNRWPWSISGLAMFSKIDTVSTILTNLICKYFFFLRTCTNMFARKENIYFQIISDNYVQ